MSIVSKEELDAPVMDTSKLGFFQKDKIKVVIIFEDRSHKEFNVKLGDSYFLKILKGYYLLVPEAITNGKQPMLIYFYNNPLPINLKYQRSELSALGFRTTEQLEKLSKEQKTIFATTILDTMGLRSAFENRLIMGMYDAASMLSTRNFLIILGGVVVSILVLLQMTGTVDVMGFISGK